MPEIKRTVRNPGAGTNLKMVLSMISFMLLASCSAPFTTDVFIAGGGTSGAAAGMKIRLPDGHAK